MPPDASPPAPPEPEILLSVSERPPPGPVQFLCDRHWETVTPIGRGVPLKKGTIGRVPDLYVEWPWLSLDRFGGSGLVLLKGRYDAVADRLREPEASRLSVPEALERAPHLAQVIDHHDRRWSRSSMPSRPEEIVGLGLVPGTGTLDSLLKQLAPEADDRMPPEITGPNPPQVRPELFLGLVVIHKRRPELIDDHKDRVQAKVRLALSRLSSADRARHAPALAYLLWTILDDRERALDLFTQGVEEAPIERSNVNHYGVDALGLPPELVFAYLARTGGGSEKDRAVLKRYLLDPMAVELMLGTKLPLPGCFYDGGALPILDPAWIPVGVRSPREGALKALLGQFAGWVQLGKLRVTAQAAAGVDRMPMAGTRPPDPKGVQVTLYAINPEAAPEPFAVTGAQVAWGGGSARPVRLRPISVQLPAHHAGSLNLGAIDDHVLVPGEAFRVTLSVRSGQATETLTSTGEVMVAW